MRRHGFEAEAFARGEWILTDVTDIEVEHIFVAETVWHAVRHAE